MTRETLVHRWLTLALQSLLVVGIAAAAFQGQWLAAFATGLILLVTLLPLLAGKKLDVFIPPELEGLAVLFVFASLFLGEVHGYYLRYWWWDLVLHTASGLLLGILGFLLVYVLNEKPALGIDLKPGFLALFAFMFSLGLGALWEIFEFWMDSAFGTTMQKSLRDTMFDLIVDALGALAISLFGYVFLKTSEVDSFLERWILSFIEANPRLFRTRD
ncbi:MAG: hypothetical protein LC732_03205 [Acidobacteria bacterium]|nr:hypothetical protein [Acidobacteriota bacterium]